MVHHWFRTSLSWSRLSTFPRHYDKDLENQWCNILLWTDDLYAGIHVTNVSSVMFLKLIGHIEKSPYQCSNMTKKLKSIDTFECGLLF